MTNRLVTLSMVSAAMLLASCSNTLTCGNSHPYANSNPVPPLKAPAGVTIPAPDPAYLVPAAGTAAKAIPAPAVGTMATAAPAAASNGAQPCLVTPPDVLTKADMARPTASPGKPVPAPAAASQAVPKPAPTETTQLVPAAATHAASSPVPSVSTRAAPASGTRVPPVADRGSME